MANGLLDFISTPEGQGLLSAAFGGLAGARRGTPFNNLGRAGLAGLGGYVDATDRVTQQDERAKMNQMRDLQLKQAQQQMADAEARRELAKRFAMTPGQMAVSQNGGPTLAAAQATQNTAPGYNYQGYGRALASELGDIQGALAIEQATKKAPRKLSKLEQMKADDGRMVNVAVFEDGTSEVLPYGVKPEMVMQSLGNRVVAIDKNSVPGGQSFVIGQSADSAASNETQRRGQNMVDARERERIAAIAARPLGGNAKTGPMSVTLQKELLESDDAVQSSAAVVRALEAAKLQNNDAYSGYLAKPRAVLRSNLPGGSAGADATIDIDNLMTGQGLEQMKSIFGAAPTEGERKILLEMQASVDKTPTQREAIMNRAIAAAQRRAEYAARKAKAIRDGSYLTDGISQAPETPPAKPEPTDADIKFTALKYGLSPAEVRAKLGLK